MAHNKPQPPRDKKNQPSAPLGAAKSPRLTKTSTARGSRWSWLKPLRWKQHFAFGAKVTKDADGKITESEVRTSAELTPRSKQAFLNTVEDEAERVHGTTTVEIAGTASGNRTPAGRVSGAKVTSILVQNGHTPPPHS